METALNLNNQAPARFRLPTGTNPLKEAVTKLYIESQYGLQLVEERVRSRFASDAAMLTQISEYLFSLGGKRIRPLLALTCAKMFGVYPPSPELVDAAAGIELTHMATLLHDDIIDESPVRRHRASAYREHGLAPTLCAGDFLLARAFGLCARLDPTIIDATEQACIELTEGEVLEGKLSSSSPVTLEEYITIARKKTASLFSLSAFAGTHFAGARRETSELARNFGYCAGVAFQMADDILDITANEQVLGKPAGTDLKQQTPSLVNILWLQSGDPKALDFFSKDSVSDFEVRTAVEYLKTSPIVGLARVLAREYQGKAKEHLMAIDDPKIDESVRTALCELVDFTVERSD